MARNQGTSVTEADLPWLAGLLEGEGCFFYWTDQDGRKYPGLTVGMSDEDVILRVANMLKRAVVTRKPRSRLGITGNKSMHVVRLVGKDAVALMSRLYPYMGQRRRAKITEITQGQVS